MFKSQHILTLSMLAVCFVFTADISPIVAKTNDAKIIEGPARVYDGDSIRVVIGDDSQPVRIWGIDAVELAQTCEQGGQEIACGKMAREALKAIINGAQVSCTIRGRSYKRLVGTCHVNDRDIAQEMVRIGMAFDAPKYSKDFYRDDEDRARAEKIGLWAMDRAEQPARWRLCNMAQYKKKRPKDCDL